MAYRKIGSHRSTKNFIGTRLSQPETCLKDSYFTIKTENGREVFCKSEKTGKTIHHASWRKK